MALALTRQSPPIYEKPRDIARGQEARLPWAWDSLCFAVAMHQASVEGFRDLVSNVAPAASSGVWGLDNRGNPMAYLQGSSGFYVEYTDHPMHDRPSTELTVYLRLNLEPEIAHTSPNGGFIINRYAEYDEEAPGLYSSWGMQRDAGGQQRMYATLLVGGTQYTLADTALLPDTEYVGMFLRWRSGEPPRVDVLDERGVVLSSVVYGSNVTGTIGYGASEGIWLNGIGPLTRASGWYSQALVWSRRLGDAEMSCLVSDPFGWYSPRRETVVITGTYLGAAPSFMQHGGRG